MYVCINNIKDFVFGRNLIVWSECATRCRIWELGGSLGIRSLLLSSISGRKNGHVSLVETPFWTVKYRRSFPGNLFPEWGWFIFAKSTVSTPMRIGEMVRSFRQILFWFLNVHHHIQPLIFAISSTHIFCGFPCTLLHFFEYYSSTSFVHLSYVLLTTWLVHC